MSGELKEHDKGLEVSRNKGEGKAYDNICQEEYHDTWFLSGHPRICRKSVHWKGLKKNRNGYEEGKKEQEF